MRYSKIVRQNIHANADHCIYARQQSALKLLTLVSSKSRFIAIDESWLEATDCRSRCWQRKSVTNSLPDPLVRPRISVIAAVTSCGESYITLSQSNTDSETMEIYLRQLVAKLD